MADFNYMNLSSTYGQGKRDVALEERTAAATDSLREQTRQREINFSDAQRFENTRYGAGAAKHLLDLYDTNPQMVPQIAQRLNEEMKRRNMVRPDFQLSQTPTREDVELMYQTFMSALGGGSPEASSLPPKVENAEWWLAATPEQRRGYMEANYSGSVREIGGVPHWVHAGGESVPLSDTESELAYEEQKALRTGEASRGRVQVPGSDSFEAVPGTEAAQKEAEDQKKILAGAKMKSIQSQTVVEDVQRLNQLLAAGRVPLGRAANAQQLLPEVAQSRDYRNALSLVESVKGNVGVDSLLRIKASGAGLGQVPQTQLDMLSRLLGELDLSQEPEQFKFTWERMGRVYQEIWDTADAEMRELGYPPPQVFSLDTNQERTATNPNTGERVRWNPGTGQWEPM